MRNRAKCRLCGEIIESFAVGDYITCKCGEIGVHGGPIKFECAVRSDWGNFVRIDDNDKEVEITVKDKSTIRKNQMVEEIPTSKESLHVEKGPDVKPLYKDKDRPTKEYLLNELERMIALIEGLPQGAMLQPVTHYDLASALILISSILRSD